MKFPEMDDPDALPSSYVTRVLAALGKWACKLQTVIEFLESIEATDSSKTILNFS